MKKCSEKLLLSPRRYNVSSHGGDREMNNEVKKMGENAKV